MSAGSRVVSVLKKACGARLPSGSLTRTQRIGLGGVPVRTQSAVSEAISSVFSRLRPPQEETVILCHDVAGSESKVFNLGNGAPFLCRSADGARLALWRGRDEIGIGSKPADEGCPACDGVGQVVDGETAVADEDDVAVGQPAAELERPLAGPVGQQLVPAFSLEVGAL